MLKKTVLVHALTLAFSGAALTMAVVQPVMAQSNAAGTVYGNAAPGAAVTLKNLETNQTRTVTTDAAGRFQATALPIGRYSVTAGAQSTQLEVLAGQGIEAQFGNGNVQAVQVTGRRNRIDVSNATNGATFTARELAKLPIAQNVAPSSSWRRTPPAATPAMRPATASAAAVLRKTPTTSTASLSPTR
jgi:hypothetical protein